VDLGVPPEILRSQASWDHGALDIAQRLGDGVHAGSYSRMFVDLNRAADHECVIPRVSYGAEVPGNAYLSPADRAARLAQFHAPYWDAVRRDCAAHLARGHVLHFSSHSFSPALDPANRTFDVGVLYDPAHPFEAALAEQLLAALRVAGLDARANQPYTGVGPAVCTSLRREFGARYAGIELETSHAVTETPDGCARIAAAVLPFLTSCRQAAP
jgi:predicted N-formylglutamate amidohydrolase